MVLLTAKGLSLDDIARELHHRHNPDWDKKRRMAKANDNEK
jgi:phosphoribosyl-ATP pyrophosphohydrolase/phosphoribosyl-AMP cyclohydrolase